MMTISKRILAICTTLFLCVGAIGCTQPVQYSGSNDLDFSADGPGDANTPKLVPDVEETEHAMAPVKLNPALIYQPSESIDDGDLVFSNPKCYKTNVLPTNISAEEMDYSQGDLAEGTSDLVDGKEYLFVDIDIANISSVTTIYNIGSLAFIFADSNYVELDTAGEVLYFSAGEDKASKSFYNLSLEPNEKKTITLGYIFNTDDLGSNSLYFAVSDGGATAVVENSSEPIDDDRRCFALQLQ